MVIPKVLTASFFQKVIAIWDTLSVEDKESVMTKLADCYFRKGLTELSSQIFLKGLRDGNKYINCLALKNLDKVINNEEERNIFQTAIDECVKSLPEQYQFFMLKWTRFLPSEFWLINQNARIEVIKSWYSFGFFCEYELFEEIIKQGLTLVLENKIKMPEIEEILNEHIGLYIDKVHVNYRPDNWSHWEAWNFCDDGKDSDEDFDSFLKIIALLPDDSGGQFVFAAPFPSGYEGNIDLFNKISELRKKQLLNRYDACLPKIRASIVFDSSLAIDFRCTAARWHFNFSLWRLHYDLSSRSGWDAEDTKCIAFIKTLLFSDVAPNEQEINDMRNFIRIAWSAKGLDVIWYYFAEDLSSLYWDQLKESEDFKESYYSYGREEIDRGTKFIYKNTRDVDAAKLSQEILDVRLYLLARFAYSIRKDLRYLKDNYSPFFYKHTLDEIEHMQFWDLYKECRDTYSYKIGEGSYIDRAILYYELCSRKDLQINIPVNLAALENKISDHEVELMIERRKHSNLSTEEHITIAKLIVKLVGRTTYSLLLVFLGLIISFCKH